MKKYLNRINYIIYLTYIFYFAAVLAMVFPGEAKSANEQILDGGKSGDSIKIVLKEGFKLEGVIPQVKIVPGESEFEKREREKASKERLKEIQQREEIIPRENRSYSDFSLDSLRDLYKRAAAKFGIDWRLIEAVHQVETGKSGDTCKRNPSGATGPMQFMPSTFRTYANEGSDICSVSDSVFAAANLLAKSGADRGDIDAALYNYNHSRIYVEKVKEIMNGI